MAYTPKTWVDGSAGGTPITAAELNRMEAGIASGGSEVFVVTDANAVRPTGYKHIIWKCPTQPVNWVDGDEWIQTA